MPFLAEELFHRVHVLGLHGTPPLPPPPSATATAAAAAEPTATALLGNGRQGEGQPKSRGQHAGPRCR
jgi:hypothetical protein